jgi:phenylalanyl-tRNA synthetase beta subunit
MKVSLEWLQSYFEDALPELDKLAELLTLHAFEVEAIEDVEGIKVLDIDILPNRANTCLSHYYIAQEIASLTGLPIKPIPHTEFVAEDDSKDVSINI